MSAADETAIGDDCRLLVSLPLSVIVDTKVWSSKPPLKVSCAEIIETVNAHSNMAAPLSLTKRVVVFFGRVFAAVFEIK